MAGGRRFSRGLCHGPRSDHRPNDAARISHRGNRRPRDKVFKRELASNVILQPANLDELSSMLADVHARGKKISAVDISVLNRVLEHKAEDMTARVEAGITLAELQKQLALRGQWLPVDPPNPEGLSLGALLATNVSGPRRFGYGTVRDYVIGIAVVLGDGRLVHSGGNVVKNVAGYDLMKLFIGSQGTLGVICEARFKLRPLPESEKFVEAGCAGLEEADKLIETVLDSELTPVVLDLHNLAERGHHLSLVVGFAGTDEEVEWQLSKAAELGFSQPSSLDYEKEMGTENGSFHKVSVLPSKTVEVIRALKGAPFIARAGNGIIYHQGSRVISEPERPNKLAQRLKEEFDPKHILPDLVL